MKRCHKALFTKRSAMIPLLSTSSNSNNLVFTSPSIIIVHHLCLLLLLLFSSTVAAQTTGKAIEYSIREELPVGSFVGNVKRDSNLTLRYSSDDAHKLRFQFRHTGQSYRYFNVDERTGVLSTSQVLDRETLCPFISSCDLNLDISVKPVQFFQIIRVLVRIADINDNAPIFPQERLILSITETTLPGALFLVPAAEDADSGILGIQEYQLLSDFDEFQLVVSDQVDGSKDLRLKLVGRLDREVEDRYTMTVVALDGGRPQKTGSVELEIIVLDANDNSPQFDNISYEVELEENQAVSTTLIRVQATDPDDGENGIVVYAFADYTERAFGDLVEIDERTGDIYLISSLDYETVQTFQLTVKATDMGFGSLPVFAKVTVNVLDLNDNAPQISVNVLTDSDFAHIRENMDPGTFVAHAAVKDADSGPNSQVDCFIDNRALFDLESLYDSEYKITTAVTFDREERSYYDISLTCRDRGNPSLSSVKKIDVMIIDENDNAPQLPKDIYELSLTENNPVNALLTRIVATDLDEGKNSALLYRIQPLDDTSDYVLVVDPVLGKINTRIVFDYEKKDRYSFLLTVSDRGDIALSATATLSLTIIDTNDEWPKFDRSIYYMSAKEGQPTGSVVGKVNATDMDATSEFRRVFYRFQSSNGVFDIDEETGEIRNMKRLDREDEDVYSYVVIAYNDDDDDDDNEIETKVNVTVYIDDENDNEPIFQFPSSSSSSKDNGIEIRDNSAIGTVVTRLIATDADIGENARLTYSISNGDADNLFEIDATTGVIVLARELPSASGKSSLYKLVVVVRDNGSPQLMSVADLHVRVDYSTGASVGSAGKAAQADLGTLLLEGNNLIILVGAALGLIVVLTTCVVVAVLCVRRRRRSRRHHGDKYMTSSCDGGHLQVPSSFLSPSSYEGMKTGSLASTMDSTSVRSTTGSHHHHHHHSCDCSGRGDAMMMMENETTYIDRIPIDWPMQDSGIIANDNGTRGTSTLDVIPQNDPCSTPSSFRCRMMPGNRSCSPNPPPSHHHHQHCSRCCCSNINHSSSQGRRHNTHRSPSNRVHSNVNQSPASETIPLQTISKVRGGSNVDQDMESICSGSTWTDSGRGPSEEDDHIRGQLEPFLKCTSNIDQNADEQKRLMIT